MMPATHTLEQLPFDEKVARYFELKRQMDELKEPMEALKAEIKEILGAGTHRVGSFKVQVIHQDRKKYDWGRVPPYLMRKMSRFEKHTFSESLKVTKLE